jgi:hypothetical protein
LVFDQHEMTITLTYSLFNVNPRLTLVLHYNLLFALLIKMYEQIICNRNTFDLRIGFCTK